MTLREKVLAVMDKRNIIGQPDYPIEHNGGIDGGDSINRMGHYHFLLEANKRIGNNIGDREDLPSRTKYEYEIQLSEFECKNSKGNYRRHPEETKFGIAFYCNGTYDGVMSRDQTIPLIISLAVLGMYRRLGMYFLRHLMRGLLFTTNTRQNALTLKSKKLPDLTGPEFLGLFIRSNAITGITLYPLLFVSDFFTLVGSIIRRFQPLISKNGNINDDVINHLSICIYGAMNYPTPIIWIANKINSYENLMEKLKFYCGDAEDNRWRRLTFFIDLYEQLMTKYMK